MRMQDIKVGDRVTVTRAIPAYYSGYGGRPVQYFEPGMVGTVASVDVPVVIWRGKGYPKAFVCVDFEGQPVGTSGHNIWRAGPYARDLVKVE